MKAAGFIALTAACLLAQLLASSRGADADFTAPLRPLFDRHCIDCHDADSKKGGLDLAGLSRDLSDAETLRRWVRVFDRVAAGEMPPAKKSRPEPDTVKSFLASLAGALTAADRALRTGTVRRLNRIEYENTVRDLFRVRAEVAAFLPEDGKAHGFDTVGEALSASTELLEGYLRAADVVVDMVLAREKEPPRIKVHSSFNDAFKSRANAKLVYRFLDDGVVAYLSDLKSTHVRNFAAPAAGTYRVKVRARAYRSTKPIKVEVGAGDVHKGNRGRHPVGYFDAMPELTEIVFEDLFREGDGFSVRPFGIGNVRIGQNRKYDGPGLLLVDYDVEGPLDTDLLAGRRELLGGVDLNTGNVADANEIFARLLPRAFRRPVTEAEVARYTEFVKRGLNDGQTFDAALRVGLRAVLCAPEFLFLTDSAGQRGPLAEYALASRLSYFLWSTMPDAELLALAGRGALGRPATLRAQVDRMLSSPKAAAFTKNFTGQWLKLRDIKANEPDAVLYPEFDGLLEYSMAEETVRFFDEVLRRDLSVMEFVDSDWSILNDRLAMHYGVPGVTGVGFRRVSLPKDSVRGGLLTQASVLKVTANGTATSPVLRGVFAAENLLGVHVPPPPPVPAVEPDLTGATTLRQQLDKHRHEVLCASCHSKIDPPGFALESFDPIGGWRERYRIPPAGERVVPDKRRKDEPPVLYRQGLPVDPAGTLPTGEAFAGIREFKALLKRDPERVARCLAENLLTYGLGRGLGFSDRATVRAVVERAREKNYGLRSLVQEVVASDAFRSP